jgi:hypothetical protein
MHTSGAVGEPLLFWSCDYKVGDKKEPARAGRAVHKIRRSHVEMKREKARLTSCTQTTTSKIYLMKW